MLKVALAIQIIAILGFIMLGFLWFNSSERFFEPLMMLCAFIGVFGGQVRSKLKAMRESKKV